MVGALAEQIHIDSAERAVAAVLGDLADAIVVRGRSAAMNALAVVKESDSGRAALVIVDEALGARRRSEHGAGRSLASRVVRSDEGMRPLSGLRRCGPRRRCGRSRCRAPTGTPVDVGDAQWGCRLARHAGADRALRIPSWRCRGLRARDCRVEG